MSAAHNPPAFSFYANDFLTGTMTFTLAERGAYITLLAYQWDHGSIPDDAVARARVLGCARREASLVWTALVEKFTRVGDGWRNLRLEEERAKQITRHAALAENGQRGASRRWQKPPRDDGKSHSQANSQAIAGPMADAWQSDGLPSSSSGDLLPKNQGEDLSHAREKTAEKPKKNAERAGAFCEWYAEVHARLMHVGYIGNPRKDYEIALQLVATFSDTDLHDATFVWFGQEDAFAVTGTRTIAKFASRASALVQAAREVVS